MCELEILKFRYVNDTSYSLLNIFYICNYFIKDVPIPTYVAVLVLDLVLHTQSPCNNERFMFLVCLGVFVPLENCSFIWGDVSVYNGHLRGPVTSKPVAKRLAIELSLPVFYD